MTGDHAERSFVLGLDGVPWELLSKWASAGTLPNVARLVEEGASGPLESTVPPTTPLAWPSIATGTWPDKHGIYAFHRLNSNYTRQMYTGRDRTHSALWDIVSPVAVGNVPMTYPAEAIDGEMVTGMITPEPGDGFTHPPELREEIEREIPEYEIGLEWFEYTDDHDRFIDDLEGLVDARRRLMRLLLDRSDWRLAFFVYTAPDRLQHLIWDESIILEHYRTLDDIVGEAMTYASERDSTLYVVSDHGFGPISTFVHLNTLLADSGHLSRKADAGTRGALSRLGLSKSTVLDGLSRVGLTGDRLVRYLPESVVKGAARRIPGQHGLYDVDFTETTAFAYGPGHIYVNDVERFEDGIVQPADVERVKQSVASTLAATTDPESGTQVLDVYDGDDLYPTDPAGPDLVAVGHGEYEEKTGNPESAFEPAGNKAGGHRSEGVFLAWGSDVAADSTPEDASVVDVAPTVLHGMSEPIPETVDGRILEEIFESDSSAVIRQIEHRSVKDRAPATARSSSNDNFDDVENRLRGLGYLE